MQRTYKIRTIKKTLKEWNNTYYTCIGNFYYLIQDNTRIRCKILGIERYIFQKNILYKIELKNIVRMK